MQATWGKYVAAGNGPAGRLIFSSITALAFIVFLAMVVGSPLYLLYDEGAYQSGALVLVDGNSLRDLLLAQLSIPTGPLYAVLHAALAPVTGLQVPGIRFVNPVLLVLIWAMLGYTFAQMRLDSPFLRSAALVGVPMIWVVGGMALTELPALAFATAAVALAAAAMRDTGNRWRVLGAFVLSGACLGIAVLGRQVILPAIIGYLLLAASEPRLRWPATAAALATLLVTLPVFALWGGIVPPNEAASAHNQGLSVAHGLFALCYLSIILLILAPAYFFTNWRWTIGAGIAGGIVGMIIGDVGFQIAGGITSRLPEVLQPLVQRCATGVLIGSGSALGAASLVNMWTYRQDRIFVLSTCLMGGLALTAAGMTLQFSSRYLMTAFPFVVISAQVFFRPNLLAAARIALGAGLGAMLLLGYYRGPDDWSQCTMDGYRAYCLPPAVTP